VRLCRIPPEDDLLDSGGKRNPRAFSSCCFSPLYILAGVQGPKKDMFQIKLVLIGMPRRLARPVMVERGESGLGRIESGNRLAPGFDGIGMEIDVKTIGFWNGAHRHGLLISGPARGRLFAEPVSPTRSEFQRDPATRDHSYELLSGG